jgi:hypothetical protein
MAKTRSFSSEASLRETYLLLVPSVLLFFPAKIIDRREAHEGLEVRVPILSQHVAVQHRRVELQAEPQMVDVGVERRARDHENLVNRRAAIVVGQAPSLLKVFAAVELQTLDGPLPQGVTHLPRPIAPQPTL